MIAVSTGLAKNNYIEACAYAVAFYPHLHIDIGTPSFLFMSVA